MSRIRGPRLELRLTPERSAVLLPAALFLVLSLGVALFGSTLRQRHLDDVAVRTEATAEETAFRIGDVIDQRLQMVQQLRLDWQDPERDLDDLKAVASLLQQYSRGLLAINWVAADGTIEWVAPLEENRSALGKNLTLNPDAAPIFLRARNQREVEISPPLELYQGGRGLVAYLPVERDDDLLGLLNAVIRFEELVKAAVSSDVKADYDLELLDDDLVLYEIWNEAWYRESRPTELAHTAAIEVRELDPASQELALRLIPSADLLEPDAAGIWIPVILGLLLAVILALLTRQLLLRRIELRRQQQLMDRIFSRLPVSALQISPQGKVVQSIGAGAERLGLLDRSRNEDSLHEIPTLEAQISRALAGEAVDLEVDGVWKDEPWTYRFFFFPDEVRGAGAVGFAIDISERKRAEDALRRSEEQYRRVFQEAPFAYLVVDNEGRIDLANPRAAELSGYSVAELEGRNVLDLYAPGAQGRNRAAELFDRMLMGEEIRNLEVKLKRRDGSILWGSLSIQAIQDAEGELVGCRYLLIDISRRKELEERFRQSQKMEAVGRLAGGIAHDFNNLLTAIMGYARLGTARIDQPELVSNDLEEIQKAGKRAAALISQLLTFSRRQIVETQVFDLNDLIREMDAMLRRLVREEVEIFSRLQGDLSPVRMDPGQMEQVVMNLVVNSQEAIDRTGLVTLETDCHRATAQEAESAHGAELEPGKTYVRLRVSDDGGGMSPEVEARVFEPFFTTKEEGTGTGLGLATVYGIVEQSGGSIVVESEKGKGTSISILLLPAEEEIPQPEVETATSLPRGDETILLVEDEDTVRRLARQMLDSLGYEVWTAADGLDALARVEGREEEIDLLLTDVVMPRMGGEVLHRELETRRSPLKVLYSSGYTESAVIHHGVRDGEVPFMHKPYTLDDLARSVRRVLDGRNLVPSRDDLRRPKSTPADEERSEGQGSEGQGSTEA